MLGRLLGTGRTAEVYEWTPDRVIKLFYRNTTLADVNREFSKHQLIEKAIAYCVKAYTIETINQRHGIVYDRVKGMSMMEKLMAEPTCIEQLARRLGRTHADLHKTNLSELTSMKTAFEIQLKNSPHFCSHEKTQLIELLDGLPGGEVLCHMDFHPDNLFVDGETVTVLDWSNALKGDPMADVARTIMILQFAEIPNVSAEERENIDNMRHDLIKAYINGYGEDRINDPERLKDWTTVLLALRLSENNSEAEKNLVSNELIGRLKERP